MKAIIAILVVGSLEAYAIYQGLNGVTLSLSVAAITGLGGYEVGILRQRRKKQNGKPSDQKPGGDK